MIDPRPLPACAAGEEVLLAMPAVPMLTKLIHRPDKPAGVVGYFRTSPLRSQDFFTCQASWQGSATSFR
jgi:hypothetical protein